MESSVHSTQPVHDSPFISSQRQNIGRLDTVRKEMEYLNTIGKRFVAAFDRFQVHRALLIALQDVYSFSACCILLRSDLELFIIPCYPLQASFLESMIQRIASAASALNFPLITPEQLARTAYFDAPDDLAQFNDASYLQATGTQIGSCLNIPLTVENRIIGMLSLFDERVGTFDTNNLQLTTMIADYAAVALENVRLRERENSLWREAELERMRLELIIGSMAEGLLITDARGSITSLNRSAEQLLNQALPEIQPGISLYAIEHSSRAPWLPQLIEVVKLALSGQIVKNRELPAGNGKSEERVPLTLSISAAPLHDSNDPPGKPIGVVAVLNDITSTKQVERLKDEFVSVVSHELRTPLTAIKGYTQHLVRRVERRLQKFRKEQQTDNPTPTTGEYPTDLPESQDLRNLHIVQSQTEHLERIVNDLLDLSRVQWGQLTLQYEVFDLRDLLVEAVRSVQASAEQHKLYLDIQCADTRIKADRTRINQVVGNLLDNAVKYSPHGGQVHVTVICLSQAYQISISDQGIGIHPDHVAHIFERFYRVHNTPGHHYAGIGLGLYIAKAILDRHHGQIWLAANKGRGSTFHFTLPTGLTSPE